MSYTLAEFITHAQAGDPIQLVNVNPNTALVFKIGNRVIEMSERVVSKVLNNDGVYITVTTDTRVIDLGEFASARDVLNCETIRTLISDGKVTAFVGTISLSKVPKAVFSSSSSSFSSSSSSSSSLSQSSASSSSSSSESSVSTFYYVGNGGLGAGWGNASYWSSTSGGSGGAGIPDANTSVIFDSNSPGCSFEGGYVAYCYNFNAYNTGYTGTFSASSGSYLSITNNISVNTGTFNFNGGVYNTVGGDVTFGTLSIPGQWQMLCTNGSIDVDLGNQGFTKIAFDYSSGTKQVNITNSFSAGYLTIRATGTAALTVVVTTGVTLDCFASQGSRFIVTGYSGGLLVLKSDNHLSTQFNLICSSGDITGQISYADVSDCNGSSVTAEGGTNVNGGNNTGIPF